MTSSRNNSIRLAEPGAKAAQSPVRKKFNTLVKKLEAERARLTAWQAALPGLHRTVEQELRPLQQAHDALGKQLLVLLDQMSEKLGSKRDKAKLSNIICVLAENMLEEMDDEDISAIYERHGGEEIDTAGEAGMFKEMLEELTGMPLDDDIDLRSPDAVLAALQARMDEQEREQEQQREQEREARQAAQEKAGKKPKQAKVSAREQRLEAEAKRMQQSVREIYRKLASALHPDREPDPAERDRKTALMQRVNVAYAANDLLGLLELQLQIEQLDQAGLDSMDDERIKQFNKLLAGQVAELEQDNANLEFALTMDFGIERYGRLTPRIVQGILDEDKQQLESVNRQMTEELAGLQDVKNFKAWLKAYRIPRPSDYDDWY